VAGSLIMAWNVWKTISAGEEIEGAEVPQATQPALIAAE
jgi:cytochrome c oxidase cbb3-type subunit 1